MTQCERIFKFMKEHGSINPMQAMKDLGVMRLAARVADLKKAGYKISRRTVTGRNRYGEPVSYAEYRLEVDSAQQDFSPGPTCSGP